MSADTGTPTARIGIDRVRCTGHGACAEILPRNVDLDPWGYPVVRDAEVERRAGQDAVRLCPARALFLDR